MTVLEPVIQFLCDCILKTVTLSQVIEGADRPRKPVLRVMDRLVREGYLFETEDNKIPPRLGESGRARRNPTWRIIKKPKLETFVPRPSRNTLRDRMWRIIRARRRITTGDLARLSGANANTVNEYTRLLVNCGYLRIIGRDNRQNVYHLVKDPGPVRPVTPQKRRNNAQ